MKLEHIDNLTRWKKSWINIWSRSISHRLRPYEREKYNLALKNKYLQIDSKDRENLLNIWYKVCDFKWWNNIVFLKNNDKWIILKDDIIVYESNLDDAKNKLNQLIKK